MSYIPLTFPGATVSRPITGRYLAHNHLPARRRALLAGDLATGKVHLVNPTISQAALLARVSIPYAAAGRTVTYSRPHLRGPVENGERSLLEAADRKPSAGELLAKAWSLATPAERIAFIRLTGPDAVFDVAVEAA